MIGKLRGVIDTYGEDFVVIDVHGVGYVVHCSARTLQRRLSEQGTTFTELLVEVRVAEAERQLLETDASVSTIGYATGFSDSAHFTRTFRARTGRTPSSVRGQRRC